MSRPKLVCCTGKNRKRQIAAFSKMKVTSSSVSLEPMKDIVIRFLIGGLVVSLFSLISDLLKPKTFAGLFGAAPSVALASLGLTVFLQGREIAAIEAHSMIFGAIALLIYASAMSWIVLRFRMSSLKVFLPGLLLWLGIAMGLWFLFLGA